MTKSNFKNAEDAKVLIIGGGQVSRDLKQYLPKSKKVMSTTKNHNDVNESTMFLDLTRKSFPSYLYSENISEVIILAGIVGEKLCLDNLPKAMDVNVTSTLQLLEGLHDQEIPNIFVSSSSAFAVQHDPRKMLDTKFNVYGQLKRWIELEICERFNFTTVLRLSKVITSSDERMHYWVKTIRENANITVPENLKFSPISSAYFASLIDSGLIHGNGILNLSATENVSYYNACLFLQNLISTSFPDAIEKSIVNSVTFDTEEYCEVAQADAYEVGFLQNTWEQALVWFLNKQN